MQNVSRFWILKKVALLILVFLFLPTPLFGQDEFLPTIEDTLSPAFFLRAAGAAGVGSEGTVCSGKAAR